MKTRNRWRTTRKRSSTGRLKRKHAYKGQRKKPLGPNWRPVSELAGMMVEMQMKDDDGRPYNLISAEAMIRDQGKAGVMWLVRNCPVTNIECVRFLPARAVAQKMGMSGDDLGEPVSLPLDAVIAGGKAFEDALRQAGIS